MTRSWCAERPHDVKIRVTIRQTLLLLAIAAAILGAPASAAAQQYQSVIDCRRRADELIGCGVIGPQRPSDGWLFEKVPDPAAHKLDLTMSSSEGYDNNVPFERHAIGGSDLEPGGYATLLSGAGTYAWRNKHALMLAAGASTVRYYRSTGGQAYSSDRSAGHTGALGFSYGSDRTVFAANQTATYSSSPLFDLFPRSQSITLGGPPTTPPDSALKDAEVFGYSSGVTLSHVLTSANSLAAAVEWQHSQTLFGPAGPRTLNVYASRTYFSHRVARNTMATIGYLYRIGDGTVALPGQLLAEQGIEAGIDHRRVLSATRHLTFRARLGASTVKLPQSAEGDLSGLRYGQLSGEATVGYEFGRTWQAAATYRRGGIEYVAGLATPVSSTSFTSSIDGLVARRLDLLASAGYSSGESALNRTSSFFETYTGNVRLRYALTRVWAAYIDYTYYFYDSHGSVPLFGGLPSSLMRQNARTGFVLRVPTIRR